MCHGRRDPEDGPETIDTELAIAAFARLVNWRPPPGVTFSIGAMPYDGEVIFSVTLGYGSQVLELGLYVGGELLDFASLDEAAAMLVEHESGPASSGRCLDPHRN